MPQNTSNAEMTSAGPRTGGPLSGGLGVVVFIALFGAAAFLTYRTLYLGGSEPEPVPLKVMFVCSETGKPFEYELKLGEIWPVESPFSHHKSGYPAEACYWTRDGKRKLEPTWVILNEYLGKKGDTFCPDCGRLVIGHNPRPPDKVPLVNPPSSTPPKPASRPS